MISQSIACSQYHRLEQRLARWILTMDDYAQPRALVMSHEFIAGMLAAPGMPLGAPGMEASRTDPHSVMSFTNDGASAVYAKH